MNPTQTPARPARFEGSDQYVATDDLKLAVNAAMTLQRPLLIKGEPGTGKTMLAEEVAAALGMPLLQWHVKSTTKAQQGLYGNADQLIARVIALLCERVVMRVFMRQVRR